MPECYIVLGVTVLLVFLHFASAGIEQVRLVRKGMVRETAFPVSQPMAANESFEILFIWSPGILGNSRLDIHPDDCIDAAWVNGKFFNLEKYPGHCSWSRGFSIDALDLQEFGPGKKEIRFLLHNENGLGGMLLEIKESGVVGSIFQVALYLLVGILLFLIAKRLRTGTVFASILILGILVRFFYLQETNYEQRTHDVSGHLDYIRIVAEEHRIPSADDCWTCYHPPVYYTVSALPWKVANVLGIFPIRAIQWQSFLFAVASLLAGLLALRLLLGDGRKFLLAGLLWCFWPSFVLVSARIGNDSLFYLSHLVCFLLCLMYLQTAKGKFLIGATVFAGLAFFSKSTGAVSVAVFCLTVILRFAKQRCRPGLSEIVGLVAGVLVCALCGISLLGNEISGNVDGLKWVDVENGPLNYLIFDLKTFLLQPYTSPFDDAMGRQYFWNYLLKTSLFGEFSLLNTAFGRFLATALSVLLLGLNFFAFRGLFYTRWNRKTVLFALHGALFLAAAILFRIKYPFSCSNDFRYIVPVLLSVAPFVACGIGTEKIKVIRIFGYLSVCAFSLFSILLILFL